MKRQIFTSNETSIIARDAKDKFIKVYGFYPIDQANCPCQLMIYEFKKELQEMPENARKEKMAHTRFLECPYDKSGMRRYKIVCRKCDEIQGYCWAKDSSLKVWCDFHYTQWTDGATWKGCFTPHISPVNQQLCFECCCGNDTRDFRANMTMNQKTAESIEKANVKGRDLGNRDSKFIALPVNNMVI